MEKHLFVRIAAYAYGHPEWFTYEDLLKNRVIEWEMEENIIKVHFDNANHKARNDAGSTLDTMFLVIQLADSYKSKCILTFDAFFNYIDYLELQEARKNSKQAFCTAIVAIGFSFLAIIVQIITSVYSDEIKALIQNIN